MRETPEIIDSEDLEDILNADRAFHINFFFHGMGRSGKQKQFVAKFGIVFGGKITVIAAECNNLAQLQFFEKRQPVEKPPFQKITRVQCSKFVHNEFKRMYHLKSFLFDENRRVYLWACQHGESRFIPYFAGRKLCVDMSERGEPKPVGNADPGLMETIISCREPFVGIFVRKV